MMLMRLCSKTEHFSMFIIYSVNVSYFLKIYINFTHVNRCHKMKGTHFYCYLSNTLIKPVSSLSLLLSVGFFLTFFSVSLVKHLYGVFPPHQLSCCICCTLWVEFVAIELWLNKILLLFSIFAVEILAIFLKYFFMERMYKSEKNSYVWFFLIYQTWTIKWLKLDNYPYILVN